MIRFLTGLTSLSIRAYFDRFETFTSLCSVFLKRVLFDVNKGYSIENSSESIPTKNSLLKILSNRAVEVIRTVLFGKKRLINYTFFSKIDHSNYIFRYKNCVRLYTEVK